MKAGDVVEGRYRILDILGEGGMGTVFLAEHALIKRRVAIKILHPELSSDVHVIERFMNEARAAGTLGHPNIVESTDMGFTHDHVPYIVFEYLEGSLLTDEIYRVGGFPVRRALRVAQQIASALHAAHLAGIVHRDLKSDNIFLTDKDEALDHVKVLDFGISRFLKADPMTEVRGVVMGTPEFMAPEQITDPDNVDRRADIYALGVMLYEMLEARRPFSAEEDPQALMERIVNDVTPPLTRPEIPHALNELIMTRLLAKDPDDRYSSMQDVEAALDAFVTHGEASRRRSRPIAAVTQTPEDVARYSTTIPRPSLMTNTPWPAPQSAMLANPGGIPPAAKKPWLVYGLAAAGVLVGAAGLVTGMRGNDNNNQVAQATLPAPAPMMDTRQAPLPTKREPAPVVAQQVAVAVAANIPGASLTFRHRVHATPATLKVTASDIVELVEVSAPGHATKRYWLTFDRATTLNAQLEQGTGVIEATDEETLVALGEAAPAPAPTVVAVAATPPAAPAARVPVAPTPATVEQRPAVAVAMPTGVTIAHQVPTPTDSAPSAPTRKVGHAAVESPLAAETAAPTIAMTDAAMPAGTADVAMPSTQDTLPGMTPDLPAPPPGDPVGAVTEISTGKALPTTLEPKQPTTPTADPAKLPEPPKAPKPSLTPPPAYSSAQVSAVVGSHRGEVVKCIAVGKQADKAMHGTLELQLQVDASGKVKRVQMKSNLKNPLVAGCVMKSANAWRFPTHAGADLAAIKYPFVIN